MEQSNHKQSFLHGAALLAIATAVVKVIGALYKIPLKGIIGDQGFGYFSSAYQIYSVLLMISTAGFPVAMSRMISRYNAEKNYAQVRQVYTTARAIFLGLGTMSAVLMVVFCRPLAAFLNQPDAWAAILCLGPCAFLMGIISAYRGFFQGHGNMRPTSVSQVLEAIFKLIVGLVAAYFIMDATKDLALAAAGAILGVTGSCLLSAIYLHTKHRPVYKAMTLGDGEVLSFGATAKGLLAVAVPITIGSAGLQLLNVLETRLYMGQLLGALGLTQDAADTMKGIYDMGQTIFNMPCAFIIPISISVLPAITAQLTVKADAQVKATEESAARIVGLISLPCTVGMFVLAEPVMSLLGGYTGEKLQLASGLMALLSIGIFLYAIVQYTNAVMQAHGYAYIPVVNMLLSGAVKLAVVYVLVGNPAVGLLGAPIGAALCYLCIGLLNLTAIRKIVSQKPRILTNLLRPLLPAAVMGAAVFGVYWALQNIMHIASRAVLCALPIGVGVVVYVGMVVLTKTITKEDCNLLPKGEKIAKFLHL